MNTWMIPTQNDPLGAVRKILGFLWEIMSFDRVLLQLNGNTNSSGPRIINEPNQIQLFNPVIFFENNRLELFNYYNKLIKGLLF